MSGIFTPVTQNGTITGANGRVDRDLLAGSSHYKAWVAVMKVLDECVPGWNDDPHKAPVTNATDAIRKLAASQVVQR